VIVSLLLVLSASAVQPSMHPDVLLLDAAGVPVVESQGPVSAMRSCGECHDTRYIESHSSHVGAGLVDCEVRGTPGATGLRHVGGGDAAPEVELDCFLCHLRGADVDARRAVLTEGRGAWASTATLSGLGLVAQDEDGAWAWSPALVERGGIVDPQALPLGPARSEACGACHGQVVLGEEPVALDLDAPCSVTTGVVFSDQRVCDSALNLAGKQALIHPWDVHAASLLDCTSCHHAANNPAFFLENEDKRPEHLRFDGRRLDLGDYLERPNHQLAKGYSTQARGDDRLDGSMRGCEDCHDPAVGHDWLPHRVAHQRALSCEACHIPSVQVPVRSFLDWTVPTPEGWPREGWRGVTGQPDDPGSLIEGFQPILLTRTPEGERARLVPYNLTVVWTWRDARGEAVPLADLLAAVAPEGRWAPRLLELLDEDGDGRLADQERVLSTPERVAWMEDALRSVGVEQPALRAELRAYGLHHGVVGGREATRDCTVCHAREGTQLEQDLVLVERSPLAPLPALDEGANLLRDGALSRDEDGTIRYRAAGGAAGLYVPGRPSTPWIDRLGLLALLGALVGVGGHGGARLLSARRHGEDERRTAATGRRS
jgi:hypothetical protein